MIIINIRLWGHDKLMCFTIKKNWEKTEKSTDTILHVETILRVGKTK